MERKSSLLKPLAASGISKLFLFIILGSVILGSASGIYLAKSGSSTAKTVNSENAPTTSGTKTASDDTKTFKDFAEGTITKRPESKNPDEYVEGTHLLKRSDNPIPVALTSSVVDLSEYEGKQVKVYGETQKAIKEGWLMDVGKVEVK